MVIIHFLLIVFDKNLSIRVPLITFGFDALFTVIVAERPRPLATGMNATYKDESSEDDTYTAKKPRFALGDADECPTFLGRGSLQIHLRAYNDEKVY